MSGERLIVATYCDDVRQELGNKYSLMGCYADELISSGPLPVLLPKLCAHVRLIIGRDVPIETARLCAYLNDELVGDLDLPAQAFAGHAANFDARPGATRLVVSAVMVFAPFVILQEGGLRIDAETNDGTVKGPTLRIRSATADKPADQSEQP